MGMGDDLVDKILDGECGFCQSAPCRCESVLQENKRLKAALDKINTIRNSIIGTQTMNWSEHVYPLVAALETAGIKGMGYDAARPYFGTMLERTLKAEEKARKMCEVLTTDEWCQACKRKPTAAGHASDCVVAAALAVGT